MAPFDLFSFIFPIVVITMSLVFFAMARLRLVGALQWGAGFFLSGVGLLLGNVALAPQLVGFTADAVFLMAFFFYGEALLAQFNIKSPRFGRLMFMAAYLAVNVYIMFVSGSLRAELLANDTTIALLLGLPLARASAKAVTRAERLLVAASALVVIETLARVLAISFLVRSSDDFAAFSTTTYAAVIQLTGACFGLLLAAAAAGAMIMRVIGDYRDAAERDPLTGLLNRRGFERRLGVAMAQGDLVGVVLMTDVDRFKQVNDDFGHAGGDRVLKALAVALRRSLPQNAVTARMGGEEFIIFIPGASLAEGGVFAHSIRLQFAASNWRKFGIDRQVTTSLGVAALAAGEKDLQGVIDRADKCLYAAKDAGRNQVIVDGGHFDTGASVIADLQAALTAMSAAEG